MLNDDIIAAISTPIGEGAIAIVRMSGNGCEKILKKFFVPRNKKISELKSHTQYLGDIIDNNKKVIDEVLVSVMRSPRSYTAEDVVEIYTHGGVIVARKILRLLISNGARIAEPGEFTKRAFLNGKIDLSQAESIIDIIRAKTDTGLNLALKQLKGELGEKISTLRNSLLEILAHIEAEIDFPDEDIQTLDNDELLNKLKIIQSDIEKLLLDSEKGKIYREGINVVIIGRPNVGKSSLLNALLRENRAIVTDIPGTTRDVIEEYINIAGIPIKIIDTAGIRDTLDAVEKIGVEKSKEFLKGADLVLLVLDASEGLTDEDKRLLSYMQELQKKFLIIINKIDLNNVIVKRNDVKKFVDDNNIIEISAKEEIGLEKLENTISEKIVGGDVISSENIYVSRERHQEALIKAKNHIEESINSIHNGFTGEFLAIDVKEAWEHLGRISGDTVEEDVLDKIFTEFCIGK